MPLKESSMDNGSFGGCTDVNRLICFRSSFTTRIELLYSTSSSHLAERRALIVRIIAARVVIRSDSVKTEKKRKYK